MITTASIIAPILGNNESLHCPRNWSRFTLHFTCE
jgi:hypothetical protein